MYVILIGTSVITKGIFKKMNDELQRLNIFELINSKTIEYVGHSVMGWRMSHKESYCGKPQ